MDLIEDLGDVNNIDAPSVGFNFSGCSVYFFDGDREVDSTFVVGLLSL